MLYSGTSHCGTSTMWSTLPATERWLYCRGLSIYMWVAFVESWLLTERSYCRVSAAFSIVNDTRTIPHMARSYKTHNSCIVTNVLPSFPDLRL